MIILSFMNLYAQSNYIGPKSRLNTEFVLSIGNQQYSTHRWLANNHFFGTKRRMSIGYGIRWSSYFGNEQYFLNMSTNQQQTVTTDKLLFPSAQVNSLNLALFLQYYLSPKFAIGFNTDFLGFSLGGRQQIRSTNTPQYQLINAKPSFLNVLLVAFCRKGSFFREVFLRYWLNKKIGVKLGLSHHYLEYVTLQPNDLGNQRFQNNATLYAVGATWKLR